MAILVPCPFPVCVRDETALTHQRSTCRALWPKPGATTMAKPQHGDEVQNVTTIQRGLACPCLTSWPPTCQEEASLNQMELVRASPKAVWRGHRTSDLPKSHVAKTSSLAACCDTPDTLESTPGCACQQPCHEQSANPPPQPNQPLQGALEPRPPAPPIARDGAHLWRRACRMSILRATDHVANQPGRKALQGQLCGAVLLASPCHASWGRCA